MEASSRRALGIIFLTVFIDLLGFGIVLPLLARYGEFFRLGEVELGLLIASFSAMQFLFAPLWGRLSDRIGRRPVLLIGLVGSCVFYALFGLVTQFGGDGEWLGISSAGWLFITRIGAGIAGATIPTAQAYIADVTPPSERSRGMALIGAAFGIGFTFGPLLGAIFVPSDPGAPPTPAPGYLASALSGLAFLAALFMLPEPARRADAASAHVPSLKAFRLVLSRPFIGLILASVFMSTFAFAQFETTLTLLTERMGLGQRHNFYIFAYIGLTLTIAQGALVRRSLHRIGEYRMAMLGAILMAVGLGLIALTANLRSVPVLLLVLPVSVVGFAATTPSLQAFLSLKTQADEQGAILGFGQSMSALARILGPLAGFTLLKYSITLPYLASAVCMVVALGFVASLRGALPPRRTGETPPVASPEIAPL